MFLVNKFVSGVLDNLSNNHPSEFTPSRPPPPRRPLVHTEQNESEEEMQFRQVFRNIAGDDMEVSPEELKNILNKVLSRCSDLKTDGFSLDSCRSMVQVMDSDNTGKLDFHDFKHLWNNIKKWQEIYKSYDTDRSGLISADELPNAFRAAGFPLSDQLFRMVISRYKDDNGNMDFDNFISCLVRLDSMCHIFKALDPDGNGKFKVDIKEWLQLTM
ncbi:calpain small subunit 1-like [Arapaima gigas]